jgi:hypothetical protein
MGENKKPPLPEDYFLFANSVTVIKIIIMIISPMITRLRLDDSPLTLPAIAAKGIRFINHIKHL